jgi:Helix-turn-helix domain
LPGLSSQAVKNLGSQSTNVVPFGSRRESTAADHEDDRHPLGTVLNQVALTVRGSKGQGGNEQAHAVQPMPASPVFQKSTHYVASPLSSRTTPPNLIAPKTIRTVIGGEERLVVNTVSPNVSLPEVQAKFRDIFSQKEESGGKLLRMLRVAANVGETELCQRVRMSLENLAALEEDDVVNLPAPVYYRGYVSSYLRYLGITRTDLLDSIVEQYKSHKRALAIRLPR